MTGPEAAAAEQHPDDAPPIVHPDGWPADEPLVGVRRGSLLESVHRGRTVTCDAGGEVKASAGDPEGYVYLRSAAKPFQALPLFFTGAADAFGISGEEAAVACASHNAEQRHLTAVRSILRKAGLSEADLQNGAHPPMHEPSAARLAATGESPRAIHGNCSGKHAGMLAVCQHAGWDLEVYRDPDGPLQKLILRTIAAVCGVEPGSVGTAGDGCGVPVFVLPLKNLALGYARLVAGGIEDFPSDLREATRRTRDAMRKHPFMVAGTNRLDTTLMKTTDLVCKSGAEGVFAAGSPEGWGFALKISDGAGRAVAPAAHASLSKAGVDVPPEMNELSVHDLRGEVVGAISALS